MPHLRGGAPLLATLYFITLIGFLPAASSERSSSERSTALDAAELLRDAPLYPLLRGAEYQTYPDTELNPNTLKQDKETFVKQISKLDLKYDFQPFFDTNNDIDESIEVIQSEPETSIEETSIIVTPDATFLPEKYKTLDKDDDSSVPIRPDGNETITEDNDKILIDYILFKNNEHLLTDKTNVDVTDESILNKYEYDVPKRNVIPAKNNTIDDLLAEEARVEDNNDENPQESEEKVLSEDVLREILGVPKEDEGDRIKRSSGQEWDKSKTRRIKTGDTILNIHGAILDGIGDAGAAPGVRASSRVDAFVIRPSPVMRDEPREQIRETKREKPTPPQKQERELLVEPHVRARLPCDLVNVTDVRWYRDNEQMNLESSSASGEIAWRDGDALEIARASRGHAARWRCAGRDRSGRTVSGEPTRIMIYEPVRSVYLAVDGRRLDAGNTWVPVRDRTELEVRCVAEGGVPPPELTWGLLALEPTLDHRPYLRINPTNYTIDGVWWSRMSLTAARELHNATLQCEARQRRPDGGGEGAAPTYDLSAKLEIHVTYPPSFVISRWPGFGVALVAGNSAMLRCDVDANPPARAAWTRHDRAPSSGLPLDEEGTGLDATLRWTPLEVTNAGWYRCRARWMDTDYYSIGYYLNVLESPNEANVNGSHTTEAQPDYKEPDHQKVEVPLGGNVQLHCPKVIEAVANDAGSVGCWWRRVVGNVSDSWAPAGSHHAHGVLGIKEAVYEEGGEYRCVGARAPDLHRLRELKRVTLAVTGGATATALSAESTSTGWKLTCSACGRNLRVLWLRGGRSTPAILTPDLSQHCWQTVLMVPEPDEVWCVAVSSSGGAVAVFPRRVQTSPSPARHAVRALHSGATKLTLNFLWLLVAHLYILYYCI